ncbi:hypothetical protein UO65_0893 [Actinokineospora spheciospongiae]|uniref:Uncharacterized protein n=1 Tax=Actinokineospora spheciospongiae TaxID=909613 RepID=W7JCQ7_9PSEU|nr:hypothetical protein UO65_0893 [Actinokineospora spheciospongiae]
MPPPPPGGYRWPVPDSCRVRPRADRGRRPPTGTPRPAWRGAPPERRATKRVRPRARKRGPDPTTHASVRTWQRICTAATTGAGL